MQRMHVNVEISEPELLDAADDLVRLLDGDGELSPPLRRLLGAIDDAITRSLSGCRGATAA